MRRTKSDQSLINKAKKASHKWYTMDDRGNSLTGGGILPYDENGIWVVAEVSGKKVRRRDMGGRYRFEDVDIYGCMAREFNEELFFSSELRKCDVEELSKCPRSERSYVYDHTRHPTYLCYLFHVEDLRKFGVFLDSVKFKRGRSYAIRSNPNVPQSYYSSIGLEYIPLESLQKIMDKKKRVGLVRGKEIEIDYRLETILKFSLFRYQSEKRPQIERNENLENIRTKIEDMRLTVNQTVKVV